MAPPTSCKMPFALLVSLLLVASARASGVICEDLPNDQCAFAISSSSKRCVLESYQRSGAPTEYKCRTSHVGVPKMDNYIENDGCISICGVDRNMVGISSDALLDLQFKDRLCSPECFQNCPSIIDLYYNLAAGEGVHLPDLCQAYQSEPHRAMAEIHSSGVAAGPGAAPGPSSRTAPGPSTKAAPGPGAKAAPGPVAGGMVSPSGASPAAAPVAGAKASESVDPSPAAAPTSTQAGAGAGDDDDAGSTQYEEDDDII